MNFTQNTLQHVIIPYNSKCKEIGETQKTITYKSVP